MRIVGADEKKKHDDRVPDFRKLFTVYQTGEADGSNELMLFVRKGSKQRSGYTDKFFPGGM